MSITIIGGWKCEEAEVVMERKTKTVIVSRVYIIQTEWERETKTRVYRCTCTGADNDTATQNPGNLAYPWTCTARRLTSPREAYQVYEETWQNVGNWTQIQTDASQSQSQ